MAVVLLLNAKQIFPEIGVNGDIYLRNRSRRYPQSFPVAVILHRTIRNHPNMTIRNKPILRIGASGLVLPVPNKQAFPEAFRAGSRLTYYASLFNSIEVNSSFYKIPMPLTFSKWAGEVPADFRFTVKLWRGITHVPGLRFLPVEVNRFLHAAHQLGPKKGCLLIQLPPGLKATNAGQLEWLLEKIVLADPERSWKIAVEFRNRSWYTPAVEALLNRYYAARVLHDMPDSAMTTLSGDMPFVYLRFHGPAGDYKGGYSDAVLGSWAMRIGQWLAAGKDVYVYFNNTIGDALVNLTALREMVAPTEKQAGIISSF
jgi:uncharacterized protein YecE (DUF72 family)